LPSRSRVSAEASGGTVSDGVGGIMAAITSGRRHGRYTELREEDVAQ
jgi:hypothetical protein